MSFYGSVIDAIANLLAQVATGRVVGRDLKDFADIDAAVAAQGTYTLISSGLSKDSTNEEHLEVLLVGQIELPESASPSDVEEAEFQMLDEIRAFVPRVGGVFISDTGFRQSAQVSAPYGFISGVLRVGPFQLDPRPDMAIINNIQLIPIDNSTAPTGVFLGRAPDIGTGHEPDYVDVTTL